MEARMDRPRSIMGPAILIILGVLFLGQNLGLMDRSVWQLVFQFWPLLLVAVGLDMVLRGSSIGGVGTAMILLVLLVVLVVGAVVAYSSPHISVGEHGLVVTTTRSSGPVVRLGGPVHAESVSQPLDGAGRAVVELNQSVGRMVVGTMTETGDLVEGTLMLAEGEQVAREYHVSGGTGYFKLGGGSSSSIHSPASFDSDQRNWDLRLNPSVPTDLKVNTGVGSSRMDLSKLRLTGLRIDGGVSETEIVLPGTGQYHVTINGGIGRTSIQLPRGLAARIELDRGLTNSDIEGDFLKDGKVYMTRNYGTAEERAEIVIHAGIGEIAIHQN